MPEGRARAAGRSRKADDPGLSRYLPEVPRNRTVMHIPGSHTLYVGPLSCTRRHDLHARQYGNRGDVSFLFITQADVVTGQYEDLVIDALGELKEALEPVPRIFFICVFCIDDFLGTDEAALVERLHEEYPDCRFAVEHVDPVSINERLSMSTKLLSTQYSFIDPQPPERRDRGINFTGVFVPFHPDCELLSLLEGWGCGPFRSLCSCKTYDEYQDMGKSVLTLVFRLMNTASADLMRDELGIPYIVATPGYDADAVAECYNRIAHALGEPEVDFSEQVAACKKDAEETARLLNGLPVAVDCEFTLMPFSAAKALLDHGFNVRFIFHSSHVFKTDEDAERHVRAHHPEITLAVPSEQNHLFEGVDERECLGIGIDCGRLLKARHFVDIWHDEGYFGFHGIHRLMADIREAVEHEADWSHVPSLGLSSEEREGS